MNLVNIVYRYVNQSLNNEELYYYLANMDKEKFSKDEIEGISKLLEEIKEQNRRLITFNLFLFLCYNFISYKIKYGE